MPSFLHRSSFYRASPEKLRRIPSINIHERFEREGVAFALPTRTVYLEQEPAAEPA